jgi:hypothetical protein
MATASSERGLNCAAPDASSHRRSESSISTNDCRRRVTRRPAICIRRCGAQVARNWMNAQAYRWYTYYTAARSWAAADGAPKRA